MRQIPDSIQHVLPVFSRKPQNHVNDHVQMRSLQSPVAISKHAGFITSVNSLCRPVIRCLKSQLNPDRLDLIQLRQHPNFVIFQTIRPCSDRKRHNIRSFHRLSIQPCKPVRITVGIGVGLKIRDVFLIRLRSICRKFSSNKCLCPFDLDADQILVCKRLREFSGAAR